MEETVFDPYDINNYSNPINQKSTEKNKKEDSSEEQNNESKTKNVFNPYEENNDEDKLNDNDEKTKLKQGKKSKRKKTNEGLSENIDLSKNAYEDNNSKENNEEKNNNEEEDEAELPLLEELGINPQNIKNKIISIITLKRIDKKFLEESDMGGPFLIILIFAFSLVLQYKTCFGYLYGISVFGSVALFLLLNLMSKNKSILLYNTISVLGYCLIPVVFLSFFSVFLKMKMKGFLGIILSFGSIISSSISATRFFEIALDMSQQKWLIFYPICLFYTCFVLVSIF